jgi:SAM-dependent methyltransferase
MRSHDSVRYYDHHSARLAQLETTADPTLLAPFLSALAPGSRVIDLGCGVGADLRLLTAAGHVAVGMEASTPLAQAASTTGCEVLNKNILFWTPMADEWDGVWVNRTFQHLGPEETQRVVASAFRGLKPGGVLGVIVPEGTGAYEDREGDLEGPSRWIHPYTEKQLCSMIEQTGFKTLQVGRRQKETTSELLVVAKRI